MTDVQPLFKWVVLNARARVPGSEEYVNSAYEMWNNVWQDAFRELGEAGELPSDDFTRHDQVAVLYAGNVAVGSVFFSVVNLGDPMWRRDSYFKVWPEEMLEGLGRKYPGDDVLVCCYFTVSSEWRRRAAGFSAKELLGGLVVEQYKVSGCRAMVGTMRVNKGMHTLCYFYGADALKTGVIHHGVEVDLVLFDTEKLPRVLGPEAQQLVDSIFARRLDFTRTKDVGREQWKKTG